MESRSLDLRKRLPETDDAVAFLPDAALFEQLDTLEAFENVTFHDEALRTLETFVLGHGVSELKWFV
jgi:hypothetical protein